MPKRRHDMYSVYGLNLGSTFDLSRFLPFAGDATSVDVEFDCVEALAETGDSDGRLVYDDGQITITRGATSTTLRFGESSTHVVRQDRIECRLHRPEHAYLVPIQLLGMVIAVWLESQGSLVLHGSAVRAEGGAAVFLAGGKAGKTSLAVQLVTGGLPLITEDLVRVTAGEDGFVVHPGYPLVRMWPDAAAHFLGDTDGLELYHPALDKVWIPVARLGEFAGGPEPINTVYLPQRHGEATTQFSEPAPLEALRSLLAGSFLADMIEPAADPAARLEALSALAEAVRMRRLSYPDRFEMLSEVERAIRADLASGT